MLDEILFSSLNDLKPTTIQIMKGNEDRINDIVSGLRENGQLKIDFWGTDRSINQLFSLVSEAALNCGIKEDKVHELCARLLINIIDESKNLTYKKGLITRLHNLYCPKKKKQVNHKFEYRLINNLDLNNLSEADKTWSKTNPIEKLIWFRSLYKKDENSKSQILLILRYEEGKGPTTLTKCSRFNKINSTVGSWICSKNELIRYDDIKDVMLAISNVFHENLGFYAHCDVKREFDNLMKVKMKGSKNGV